LSSRPHPRGVRPVPFLLLCVGVTLLLACCLVAFVTAVGIGGIFISGLGLWFLLGIPLALALFGGGIWLCEAFIDDVESNDGPVNRVFFRSLVVVLIAMIYQKYHGEKTTAVVTLIVTNNGENGGVIKYQYFVRDDATGEDLGVMSGEVGQPGDGWLASDGGVGSVVIVEVDPAG
jgi:hypothetical protein